MTVLQIYGWINYPNSNFWGTPAGCFSQISTIIHLISMITFPLFGGVKIWMNHESLSDPETISRYGVFYDEIQRKTRS